MKIAFVSNYYNHHQHSLSLVLSELVDHYVFIETAEMTEERLAMGWDFGKKPEFVTSDLSALNDADIVIVGTAPETIVRRAFRAGKPVMRYSERPLKWGFQPMKYLPRLLRWHYWNPPGKKVFLLSASAYASADYAKFGLFIKKAYKWGYFPETKKYPDINSLIASKDNKKILWVGRYLEWKHPKDALSVAAKLASAGVDFSMDFIGIGAVEDELRALIAEYGLENQVRLLGAMKPEEVRAHMEKAGIFLFTSDRREGWGAVLNEAMNSGCAVVASRAIGSVPYLLEENKNGFVYESGNVDELYAKVKQLLDVPSDQARLGDSAYKTITDTWNAENAARNLVKLADCILAGNDPSERIAEGPCSTAPILRDG